MSASGQAYVAAAVFVAALFVVGGQQFDAQKIYTMCKEQSNATDEEVAAFQKSQSIPTTQHGKCLLACIFQNTGVMTKDGKYDAEGMIELAKQSYMKSPEKMAKAQQVVDICAQEVKNSDDICDIAVTVANCTMATSLKLGLESP